MVRWFIIVGLLLAGVTGGNSLFRTLASRIDQEHLRQTTSRRRRRSALPRPNPKVIPNLVICGRRSRRCASK